MTHAHSRRDNGTTGAVHSGPIRDQPQGPRVGAVSLTLPILLCAVSMLSLGCWAFLLPRSFAEFIAYPPFNEHLIHDAGAFQIGLGVTLLAAAWSDPVLVALSGFVVASGLHTLSHFMDRHVGGHAADVPALGLLTLIGLSAIYARFRWRRA